MLRIINVKKLVSNILILLLCLATGGQLAYAASSPQAVSVYAGADATMCTQEVFDLTSLGATISGDGVTDGIWFTSGDGVFSDNFGSSNRFSIATRYQPGPIDITTGYFTLTLVSDDPDGNGPLTEGSDQVLITFQIPPGLACNQNLNVSLGAGCQQALDIFMLMANPQAPFDRYIIETRDGQGAIIADNTLTGEHIGQNISYTVTHACGGNSCHGVLTVSDYAPPTLYCPDLTVDCRDGLSTIDIGLPILTYDRIDTVSLDTFIIDGLDACSTTMLTATEQLEAQDCTTDFTAILHRTWTAVDAAGNRATCTQDIFVRRVGLDSLILPPHYNGVDSAMLSCDGDWPRLANGYPDPSFTGAPDVFNCSNMEANYTDQRFEDCGGGYSIWRSWFIIDWCTSQDLDYNQIIKIKDTLPPVFDCPAELTVGTQSYDCISKPFMLFDVDSIRDCSGITVSATLTHQTTGEVIESSDLNFDAVPVGTYDATYSVVDECGNEATCTSLVDVLDTSLPFAICEGYTRVSVTSDGIARLQATSLDDESIDNCGIVQMDIAKMTDDCGHGLSFGPYADFCCDEIGTQIQVAFRVTDAAGNSNTCMANVRVEDKLPPEITCPSDLTISCDYVFDPEDLSEFGSVVADESMREDIVIPDAYNNGVAGLDGFMTDNCSVMLSETSNIAVECGEGQISRVFTATDPQGLSQSCTQTISVVNNDPLTYNDIAWPKAVKLSGCSIDDTDPSHTGEPTYSNYTCSMVESTYEDDTFVISDTACVKIIRTWTVIDWCQYDQVTNEGYWQKIQEIKISNEVAPTLAACKDTIVCSYADNCGPALWEYQISASDDCTLAEDMMYTWRIDSNQDGLPDHYGSAASIARNLAMGSHSVSITVEDRCGNATSCDFVVQVVDCKRPTPYCKSSITSVVMPTTGSLSIRAQDFDFGSSDNCDGPLYYSFTADIADSTKVLTCADLESGANTAVSLEMWVTDQSGNNDVCTVEFILQDPNDACPDTGSRSISGTIQSWDGKILDSIEVHYASADGQDKGMVWAIDGDYQIDGLSREKTYSITPNRSGMDAEGVSTLDLVLVQRHILHFQRFDNAYKLLAGDVNNNKSISGADVVKMRKLALGRDISLNGPSFRFVPTGHEFEDAEHPFTAPDSREVTQGGDVENLDFVVVKVGDVDGKIFSLRGSDDLEGRVASTDLYYEVDRDAFDEVRVTVRAGRAGLVQGLQLSLNVADAAVEPAGLPIEATDVYGVDGFTRMVFADVEGVAVERGEVLFTLTGKGGQSLEQEPSYHSESVMDDAASHVALREWTKPDLEVTLAGNPFFEAPQLLATSSGSFKVEIYTADGRYVGGQQISLEAGVQRFLNKALFHQTGIYLVRISDGKHFQKTFRVLKR